MKIKTSLIIIALLAIIAIVGALWFVTQTTDEGRGSEERTGIFGTLFPFNFGGGGQQNEVGGDETPLEDERPVPRLRLVSETPTSSGFLYENEAGTSTVRFVERGTGHVFETSTENMTVTRISNTTIPGIQEVLWENKDRFIIRYLEENRIQNFYTQLAEEQRDQALGGFFIDSWDRAVLDPQKTSLFSITESPNGSTGSVSRADGTNKRTVFSSPLRSWIPLQSESSLYVQTAPAPGIPGFLYEVRGGALIKVLGDVPGLHSVVSPSGRYVLFSTGNNSLTLSTLDTETGEVFEAPLDTVATKCVFVSEAPVVVFCGVPETYPSGAYPNDWLLGRIHFSDSLWLLEPTSGVATLLATPGDDVSAVIDVWQPATNASGEYVGFINKNDLSYWLLRIAP